MTDKTREEFDVWAKAKGYELWVSCSAEIVCGLTTSVSVAPGYTNPETQKAWDAWQASRESLVIELPKAKHVLPLDADRESAWDICKDACIDAIEGAGLKVK